MHRRTGPHAQRGQSLVEVAIACVVLVPLFIGVGLLGQYIHLRQQTQAAARAAAWDAAVSPAVVSGAGGGLPARNLTQDRMRALQFGRADAPLRNVTAPEKLQDPMLTTFAGRELVLAQNVVLRTYANGKSPALSEKILGPLGRAAKTVGLGEFPPDNNGMVTAEVHAVPEHLVDSDGRSLAFMDPLDTLDLDFHGRTVLLADAWNANGAGEDGRGRAANATLRSVRTAIKPLTPSDWAGSTFDNGISKFINILGSIPFIDVIFTAGWKNFEFGKTAPDVVPSDKLVPYGAKRN
jgi:hypothetical protein